MKKILVGNFMRNIPQHKKKDILKYIDKFIEDCEGSKYIINNMPKGYYIKEIKGNKSNKIYKFRVNERDRILFTYGKELNNIRQEYLDSIIFIDYCNHDEQIIKGKKININNVKQKNIIYDEEVWDKEIDNIYTYYKYNPDSTISRVVTVEKMSDMIEKEDEKALYYLNNQQYDIVHRDIKPLFLFGSAGSGKTTVGINKAFILCENKEINIGYFTYSKYLVEQSNKLFNLICDSENKNYKDKVRFDTVNKYLLKLCKKESYVKYEEFANWYDNVLLKTQKFSKLKLDKKEVWKEIRGVIKGIVYIDWIDIKIKKNDINECTCKFLLDKDLGDDFDNYIKIKNEELAKLSDKLRIYKTQDIETIKSDIKFVFENIDKNICSSKLMDKKIYKKLPNKFINCGAYEIAEKYQDWLDKNNKLDENDLAKECIKLYYKNKINMIDFLICDEVQDLTEFQIYFLYKIVKEKENIFFSGDSHQTINPTYFDRGRIEGLYKINNGIDNFNYKEVTKNYRSCETIVELANDLTALRKEKIGPGKPDYEEEATRIGGDKIFLVNNSQKNELLQVALKKHYVGIIVPDEIEKNKLEEKLGIKNTVFTVGEIKGIEKDYIICVNIISKYNNIWNEILNYKKPSKDNSYRFYFNLLYVAITRARNNLCFIEDIDNLNLFKYFERHLNKIDVFNESILKLDRESGLNDFFKEGLKLEEQELYLNAIEFYKRADITEGITIRAINRCKALIKSMEGHHKEAAEELMNICEYELAAECYKNANDKLNYVKALVYNNEYFEDIVIKSEELGIHPLTIINKNKNKIDWIDKFKNLYDDYEYRNIKFMNKILDYSQDQLALTNNEFRKILNELKDNYRLIR